MIHEGKQVLMKKFLDNKNMTWEECSKNQKMVFNDWPPEMWEIYDWEFLADKNDSIDENTKM